jgi:hypothetical protein
MTPIIVSITTPGVEVVTACAADGNPVSTIHSGRLDGERFTGPSGADALGQHRAVCHWCCHLLRAKQEHIVTRRWFMLCVG